MKKIISLLLVIVMLSFALVGCKQDNEGDDGAGTVSTGADTGGYNGLEARDYEGKELVFLTYSQGVTVSSQNDLWGDINGGPVERGIFERNQIIQDKYNVVINNIDITGNTATVTEVEKYYMAQDGAIDYVLSGTMNNITSGIKGNVVSVESIPNLQLDRDWWYTDFIDSTKIEGKNFFLIGDFAYTSWMASACLMFNQDMAETWKIDPEEIYALIRDENWTIEKFTQYTKLVYEDKGNEGTSLDDTVGFYANSMAVDAFLAGCDIRFIQYDSNQKLSVVIEDRFYDWYTWMYNLAHDSTTCYMDASEHSFQFNRDTFEGLFVKNQALFGMAQLPSQNTELRDVEFKYLYLPCPKYNEDQDRYYSWLHQFNSSSVAIMNCGKDLEMLGRVLEDFTFYSKDTVRTNYYDTLLDGIMASSETFVEMLDYIVGIYSIDLMSVLANQISWLSGSTGLLRQTVNQFGNTGVSSLIKRNGTKWQGIVDDIVEQVKKLS
ncbi:MAG: hypothetical protein IJZ83_02290 [Clostridia bacterium]|nr:hypothetical protein [Clostridia bacterium]